MTACIHVHNGGYVPGNPHRRMETGPPSQDVFLYPGDQGANHPDDAGYNLNLLTAEQCREWAQILRTGKYFNRIVIETGGGYVDPILWPSGIRPARLRALKAGKREAGRVERVRTVAVLYSYWLL